MANTRFKTHHGLNATANSFIDGKLEVTGDLVVSGNVAFSGSTVGDFKPDADQRNLGNTSLRWNLIGFSANLASTLAANGATTLSNTLLTTGAATFQNTVTITGVANVSSDVNISGILTVSNNAVVSGTGTVTRSLTANGNTSFTSGLLTVNTDSGTSANTLTVGAANVSVDSGTLFIDSVNNRVGINNTAPGVALRVTGAVDISSIANVGGALGVAGITTLTGNSVLSGSLQTIAGNVNFDSGVLFVDSVNNRVGINNTTPTVALEIAGSANVSTSVNSALLSVGTNFIANSTAIVGTGFANISTSVNSALLTVGTSFIANTTGAYHTGLVNAASYTTSGFVANTTAIVPTSNTVLLGNTVGRWVITANSGDFSFGVRSGTINSTSNGFFANSTTISVGNSTVNVAITTEGITSSGATGVNPSSNISGVVLGTTTQRWQLTANSGQFSGDVTISGNLTVSGTTTYINTTNLDIGDNIITLNADLPGATAPTENAGIQVNRGSAANVFFLWNETSDSWTLGNTNITGYANASVSVNSALLTVGTNFIANTTGAYHTGVVNALSVNAASLTVSTNFIANSIAIVGTGYANIAGSVNSAVLSVGTSFIANSLGAHHTGTINAASFTTTALIANTTALVPTSNTVLLGNTEGRWVLNANTGNFSGAVTLGTTLFANGGTGTAGQVLVSGGGANAYWGAAGISIVNDVSTDATRYLLFNENTSGSRSNVGVSSTKLTFNPSSGVLSTVEFVATSDERLKSDISTIPMALKRVSEIRGVNYTFTDSGRRSMGLIAQEIESTFPEVVNTDVDGYKSINYGSLVGVLIEAIKELRQEIEELKNGH
jgi:trimeric autotransporter adhesin